MNTGREVASGRLWRTKAENVKERVRVVLHCGTADCTRHGQLNIYEEGRGTTNSTSQPSRVIPLHLIHNVQCLNASIPSPLPTPRTSTMFRMSMTESQLMNQQPSSLWGFMLLLQTGEGVELYAEAREEQQLWMKHLNLLAMYPYSPLPEEPRVSPIKESFRARLNPAKFDADSVWAVYVLPEEVGSRIQGLGMQYLTLQSSLSSSTAATLKIISPIDMEPIVTWEASKMRRTGNLNNLMFIEIGRRCEGGPGLIWMCSTPADTHSFRETLQRFIFSGDGRPVASPSSSTSRSPVEQQAQYSYDRTTALSRLSANSSGCSSFGVQSATPPPLPEKPSSNGIYEDTNEYAYATSTGPSIGRSLSQPHSGPSSFSQHLSSTPPPPINLSTHPSRRKHQRCLSNPADMVPQSTSLGKQKSRSKDSGFNTQSFEALNFDEDFQNIDESMSNLISELSSESGSIGKQDQLTFPSDLDDVISMLQDLGTDDATTATTATTAPTLAELPPLVRTLSVPNSSIRTKHKRANSTSTCQPTHYMKHRPKVPEVPDEYVFMQPLLAHTDQESASKPKPPPPSCRQNYDQLSTIEERSLREETGPISDYENYPLPSDVAKATPIMFQPTYENCSSITPNSQTSEQPDTNRDISSIPQTNDSVSSKQCDMSSFWEELQNLENVLAGLTKE